MGQLMRVVTRMKNGALAVTVGVMLLTACSVVGPNTEAASQALAVSTPTAVFIPWTAVTETPQPVNIEPSATFPLLPTPTSNDDPDFFYGSLVITLDDAGEEIHLKKRQNFLLSLGQQYNWTVTIDPARVISQNMNLTPQPGEQGVFIARDQGVAQLRAVGEPKCIYNNPPCAWPSILFRAQIVVE